MDRRLLAAGVLVLAMVVGSIFVLIAVLEHGDAGDGSNPTKGLARTTDVVDRGAAADATRCLTRVAIMRDGVAASSPRR